MRTSGHHRLKRLFMRQPRLLIKELVPWFVFRPGDDVALCSQCGGGDITYTATCHMNRMPFQEGDGGDTLWCARCIEEVDTVVIEKTETGWTDYEDEFPTLLKARRKILKEANRL